MRAPIVENRVLQLLQNILRGFTPDPGTSDLDDEQPINLSITLGDYRRALELYYVLKGE